MKFPWMGMSLALLSACASTVGESAKGRSAIECEVGIVGGGPAGVYMAYRLSPRYGAKLCLFEKEAKLGGRMNDEPFETRDGGSVWVGTGARRVNEAQPEVLALARELGLELQTPPRRAQLIHARGRYASNPEAFLADFPGLPGPLDGDPATNREDEIYALLLREKARAGGKTLRAYVGEVAGPRAVDYLSAVSRFHADFDYEISAANYLDVLEHEFRTGAVNLYPVGGMSAFIRAMEARMLAAGVRVFRAQPVESFSAHGEGYRLLTPSFQAQVARAVFAVPPVGFDRIGGELAERIRAAESYRALLPIPVVVINQAWAEPWWDAAPRATGVRGEEARYWRAWSRDQCVNHTEIPQEPYARAAGVVRSVYTDDPACVRYWRELRERGGLEAVEREVVAGLEKLWRPRRGGRAWRIGKPLRTTMHEWGAGWYYVRAGARVSNAEIARWSMEPIPGRRNLMLVGESYWATRPGWSEGAYFSVDALLRARFAKD